MDRYIELQENLLGNDEGLNKLSNAAISKLENVKSLLETLRDFSSRIGTPRDSKSFRKNLKEKLMNTTIELKEATEIINKIEKIEVPQSLEVQKKKQIRRLRESCNRELKEATDLMKSIEKLEKIYVQNAKISIQNREGGAESFDQENQSLSTSKQMMQMNVDEELIRERENDIIELTKLMTEMNALAKLQAKYIQEQGEELDIVYDNTTQTKTNTKAAKKELESAKEYKEKLVQSDKKCLYGAIVIFLFILILFFFSGDPEPEIIIVDNSSPNASV